MTRSYHSLPLTLLWLCVAVDLKWEFPGPTETVLPPSPPTSISHRLAPLLLGSGHTVFLCVPQTLKLIHISRLCHLRFLLPGKVSCQLWHGWLFLHTHFSTQKPPLRTLILPYYPQQADRPSWTHPVFFFMAPTMIWVTWFVYSLNVWFLS